MIASPSAIRRKTENRIRPAKACIAKIEPSLKVGQILAALLEEVLEEPEKNTKEHLEARITELAKLSDKKLVAQSSRLVAQQK